MALIQLNTVIDANTINDNLLAGSQWEFLPFNAHLHFGLNASATGLIIDAYSGTDALVEGMVPLIKATAPIFPDDFTLEDIAAAGERIKVRARNTTGGNLTLLTTVRITPIG